MELKHRQMPAFIASLVVHVCLLVGLGVWWTKPRHGTSDEPDRDIGIAIVHRQKDQTRYVDATEIATEATQKSQAAGEPTQSALSAPPADLAPPLDLAGLLQSMKSTPSPMAFVAVTVTVYSVVGISPLIVQLVVALVQVRSPGWTVAV